jgi:glutaredoxin-like protein NrdH
MTPCSGCGAAGGQRKKYDKRTVSSATIKEEKMKPQVKLYSLSTCSHCKATKKLLDDCMIRYDATDVDLLSGQERETVLEEVRKLNPQCSFPTIIIGDRVIVGFREGEIRKALGL